MHPSNQEFPELSLMSTLAVKGALVEDVFPDFQSRTGLAVKALFDPTNVLMERIGGGERATLMIAIDSHIDDLISKKVLDRERSYPIGRTGIGLAIAQGAGVPPLKTTDDLKRCLLDAKSVAYSRTGASGVYFAALLERLGISNAVNARATIIRKGFTAERITAGEADIAVQQLSELAVVPGIRIVGPPPEAVQTYTVFKVAVFTSSATQPFALELIESLRSDTACASYRRFGPECID